MNDFTASRKIAALTAIIQTLIIEHYWGVGEETGKQRFFDAVAEDDPVSMAIANELNGPEIDVAFAWPGHTQTDVEEEVPDTPVMAFLSEEQRERARVTSLAEEEGDKSHALAVQEPDPPGGEPIGTEGRVRLGEKLFLAAIVKDVIARRGESALGDQGQTVDEAITTMPEPWNSRTRKRLGKLREDLREALAEMSVGDMNGSSSPEDPPDA